MYLMRLIKTFHAIYPELNPSFPSNGSARFLFEKEITLTLNFQELFSKIVRKNKITPPFKRHLPRYAPPLATRKPVSNVVKARRYEWIKKYMNFQSIPWPSFPHTPSPSWEILFSKSRRRSNIARISVILRGRGGASRRIGDGQGKRGAEWSEANSTGRTRNEYLNRDTRRVLFPSFSFSLSLLPFSTLLQLVCSPNHRPRRCPSLYPCIRLFAPSFLLFFLCFLVQRTTFNYYLFGGGLLLVEDRNVARRNVRSRRKIVSERCSVRGTSGRICFKVVF